MLILQRLLLTLGIVGLSLSYAQAEPTAALFACTQATLGQVACQANKLCLCREKPTTEIQFRWDCSALRPQCEVTPASVGAIYPNYPLSVGIDRSTHIVEQNQSANDSSGDSPVSE